MTKQMKTYDWIVIGAGITGAALAYELINQGFQVLIIEQYPTLQGATRYSYGGLAYWSGTSELKRVLCQEGINRHRNLSEELDSDTEFRELNLVLTIPVNTDPEKIAANYTRYQIPPKLLNVAAACELEPLLNPTAIAGALTVPHAHIHPHKTTQAYLQAFQRHGGEIAIAQVIQFLKTANSITGVQTTQQNYHAANTVVCAGGFSRALLQAAHIPIRIYFTHTEIIHIPQTNLKLNTLVMPASMHRFQLETQSSTAEIEHLWTQPGHEPAPPILDAGAVQFRDNSLIIGQISRVLTDPNAPIDPATSTTAIRTQVGKILPALQHLPGTWHHCLVAFSHNHLPVIGKLPDMTGIYIFSGFSNPLVFVPPLAQRFANWVNGKEDQIIQALCI